MRSIDADDVLAKIDALQDKRFKECGCPYDISVYEIVDIINACEMVDAVPVIHGKWVLNENDDMFYCTNCKNGSVRNDYPYCHWCGAVMDGEKVME